jgi:hypothetical protein
MTKKWQLANQEHDSCEMKIVRNGEVTNLVCRNHKTKICRINLNELEEIYELYENIDFEDITPSSPVPLHQMPGTPFIPKPKNNLPITIPIGRIETVTFGKYKGQSVQKLPISYLEWAIFNVETKAKEMLLREWARRHPELLD